MRFNPLAANLIQSPVQAWTLLMHTSMPGWATCTALRMLAGFYYLIFNFSHARFSVELIYHSIVFFGTGRDFNMKIKATILKAQINSSLHLVCTPEFDHYVHQTQSELSCSRAMVCWMNADNVECVCFALAVYVLHNSVGRLKLSSISSSIVHVINCEGCLGRHTTNC